MNVNQKRYELKKQINENQKRDSFCLFGLFCLFVFKKRCQCVWSVGMYNVYNQQNASFVEFKSEAQDKYYTRFVPYSKVLLPFIPYVNLKINW